MALTRIFDISRRSLATYQNALNVSANNIANAANSEYSRQRVQISSETPERSANFLWGTGVKIDSIERVRDNLIDKQIINNQTTYYGNKRESVVLSQVEQIFSEPSDLGISSLMDQFFNSWNELAVSPNSIPLRNSVVNAAENLAAKVSGINEDLDTIQYDLFNEFQDSVNSLNYYLKEINQLNQQINQFGNGTSSSSDLLDKRDTMISELSKLANISVSYDNNNNAAISIGGVFAVDASIYNEFEVQNVNNELRLSPKGSGSSVNLKGGELYAITQSYSKKIPEYQNYIDTLFTQLVQSVNGIHSSGYSMESTPATGIDFFKEYKDGKLVINGEILADPKKIAVSADGNLGNSELAITLAELSSEKVINNSTFGEFYSSLISKVGNDKLSADRMSDAGQMVVEQLENQRASVSGVSVDEEMTEIIKFQRAYDASAKLIKIADEMLDTVMNLV